MNLSHIISQCCQQDRAAQKQLYLAYCDYLMSVIYRYVGDIEASKDVLQNTFIKIYNNIESFDANKAQFKTWIHRIAINESIRFIKKRSRHSFEQISDNDLCSTESVDLNLELQEVISLIQQLPDTYRSIINLYHIEEYSHSEIAQLIGIKVSSSRSQLARAKKLLLHKY